MMNAGFPPPQGMPPAPPPQMAQSMGQGMLPTTQQIPQNPQANLGLPGNKQGFNLQDFLKNPEVQKMLASLVGGQQQQAPMPQMPPMMAAPGVGQWQPPQMMR